MIFDIFLTLFLVFLNGFFVAAEFAIVKVRSSQIEVKSNVNKRLAGAAKSIVSNLDAYLAATQLGITLASLGLGWVGEDVMSGIILKIFDWMNLDMSVEAAHKLALPIAFALITILHIIFGELAPKSVAIRFPTSTTFAVAWPLKVFHFVFRPFIWMLNGLANLILKLIGIQPIHGSEIHSEEELKMIISESQEGGAIEQTERELIQNVFDFDDRRVWDIQTQRKNITGIEMRSSLKEAIDFAIIEGYSRYPVYDGTIDDIKGFINTKDLMRTMVSTTPPSGIGTLIRKTIFVSENKKIKDLLKELQVKRLQMAVVTNEIGEVAGIVTMEDILEELVGEIQDEYDNEKPYVQRISESTYLISAHHKLSDINKYLPYRFEEDRHYETLAGYIAEHYKGELREGTKLWLNNYDITIIKMYRNSAELVELKMSQEEEEF
ncbi:hemolysin family protein [Polluticoccus soli]|uniref:hemolysin family protein n=1 Tax=Polluticoccus soli TaxID=3034150 RepID=UPI0023E2624C|nr:hemolysin family protein [Flavipsychrobacter sp. JY13-12]